MKFINKMSSVATDDFPTSQCSHLNQNINIYGAHMLFTTKKELTDPLSKYFLPKSEIINLKEKEN